MGTGFHGGFGATKGYQVNVKQKLKMNLQLFASRGPLSLTGHATEKSISDYREFFLGKSAQQIEKYLNRHGYITRIRPSNKEKSKATVIEILNRNKERSITQVLVSPGSRLHANIPYVKISTDHGKYKIINGKPEDYKSNSHEDAILLFRRYW